MEKPELRAVLKFLFLKIMSTKVRPLFGLLNLKEAD